jgi:DNA-binding response OmpR family regulator
MRSQNPAAGGDAQKEGCRAGRRRLTTQDLDFARILAVGDDLAMRAVIHPALAPSGYHADTATIVAAVCAIEPDGYDVAFVGTHLGLDRGAGLIQELVVANPGKAWWCLMITGGST